MKKKVIDAPVETQAQKEVFETDAGGAATQTQEPETASARHDPYSPASYIANIMNGKPND